MLIECANSNASRLRGGTRHSFPRICASALLPPESNFIQAIPNR